MPQAIVAVVVTYNRKLMLLDCISKIMQQTTKLSRIIIVDNDSGDGTPELLREQGLLDCERITYLRLAENTGGAGGFNAGLHAALAEGAGWVWCMDDDVAPEPDCLERLLMFRDISECIHPVVAYEDGTVHEWEHLFDPSTTLQVGLGNRSFRNGKEWCPLHVACFEGMLVSRRIIEIIGLPDKDFFVYGDDGHYGFLAAAHTNVIYVRKARLIKKIKPNGIISPFRMYYDIRNRFLLRRKLAHCAHLPGYSRYTFTFFLAIYTAVLLRQSFSRATALAAIRAWRDGYRNVSGRCHY